MKLKALTCGVLAALVGCNTVDRGYDPMRGFAPQPGQVPPRAPPTGQQANPPGALAYRSPAGPYGVPPPGSQAAVPFPPPSPGALPAAGAAAGALPPGMPNLDLTLPKPS